jgi:hypothetical protein
VSVMSRNQVIVPADMQRRARRIATQASKLAGQARPMTKAAGTNAKRGAGTAADWARPHVIRARAWMAIRASRGSVVVQDKVAPRVSAMMATAAKKLDPPKRQSRRLPKVLAGTALLVAGAAAATAMAIRNRTVMRTLPPPMPSRTPSAPSGGTAGQPTVLDPSADRSGREADVNGLSRTR